MQVDMIVKEWRIKKDEKTPVPKIVGEYSIVMNGTSIAEQGFNGDYNSKEVPFSGDLIKKISEIEKDIIKEIQDILK